jgi:SlyX protein
MESIRQTGRIRPPKPDVETMSENHDLTDLEIRIAYIEDTLNTLDAVIARQSEDIANLEKANRALIKKLEGMDDQLATLGPQSGDEPPPPHY